MSIVGTAKSITAAITRSQTHVRRRSSPADHLAGTGDRPNRHRPAGLLLLCAGLVIALLAGGTPASAAPAPVGLGTAASFAVLGAAAVSNTGPSVITGDVGVSPGTAVTGFPPAMVLGGTIHSADAVAAQAQSDVTIAYNDAAGRAADASITADLGGQTLVSGVYSGAVSYTHLTLPTKRIV